MYYNIIMYTDITIYMIIYIMTILSYAYIIHTLLIICYDR